MDKEFAMKLRASLEALDSRISGLEHLVNDVIIGGLKSAADEYDDDVKFSEFVDRNKEAYEPFVEPSTIIYGEDFDLPSDMYEKMKSAEGYGTEEFDEAGFVSNILKDIQDKIDALEALKDKVEDKAEEQPAEEKKSEDKEEMKEPKEPEIPSDEELSKDFDDFATRN